jgi:hypothetical protein
MFDLNPLDVLEKRKVDRLPDHFSKIFISDRDFFYNEMEDWIRAKLRGRYAIKQIPNLDKDGKLKTSTFVGFEDEKELTFFMLACPKFRR